ncbi:TadE/TadG family type IV pilus assembly protein [Maioricimonas sp. JC845]|uniref:TadE/TadG family type IV pilus assembly protein n=1 Tax=Maioricimonas sp. JC845 TaxID=3232138 RepID=UPI00345A03DD
MRARRHSPRRRGQALVEFAIIAFLSTLLLGALLTFGFLSFGANVLQQAADVGAMELSRFPYAPTIRPDAPAGLTPFEDALEESELFDEAELVVAPGTLAADLPLINQLLFPLYIYDPDIEMLRYPGTLVSNPDGDQTVLIPLIGTDSNGNETITAWKRVVEEVVPSGETEGPFSVTATAAQRGGLDAGTVALRINYPYQSAALVAYTYTEPGVDDQGNDIDIPVAPIDAVGRDVDNHPVIADGDAFVVQAPLPDGYSLGEPDNQGETEEPEGTEGAEGTEETEANPAFKASAHRGKYGLGEMGAHGKTVRPYRKVLTAQGIYRREVFE